ncbi:MAG: hypothetical protein DKT66_19410 [Candidatus Melainabacteria bacterium]|nr:MAG: hypothetical protein DKT66_19410 [Candidatus Melainabacteria bacterium]
MRSFTKSFWSKGTLALIKSGAFLAAALLVIAPISTTDGARADAQGRFDREQTMLMNLKSQPNSTGFFIIQSSEKSKMIVRDLTKALRQLEEVDKAYSKSRGKPDSRHLEGTKLKLINATRTAEKLHDELWDTFQVLKKSISETLVIDEAKKGSESD